MALAAGLAGCSGRATVEAPQREPEPGIAKIEPQAQEHFGLQVGPAEERELIEHLQVVGTVQPASGRVGAVRPLARGRVQQVLASVGDRVRRDQPLALFDNIEAGEALAELTSARAELERLKVQIANQARQEERSRRLAEIGAAPRKEHEAAVTERQALEHAAEAQQSVIAGLERRVERFGVREAGAATVIAAPFAGVVTRVDVAPGAAVGPDAELFTVVDLSTVWVQAEVYEKDLGRIRVGQPAQIEVDTYVDRPFTGKVAYISDFLDPQTRTAKVRCEVANPEARLKLDMFATVRLPTTFRRTAVAVPTDAIQQLDGRNVVFVRRDATRFEAREIGVGKAVDGYTEVTGGLKRGEPIVRQGSFHLKSVLIGKELGEEE